LLYPFLPDLLAHIRRLGMIATVTTNATLVNDAHAAMLSSRAGIVAVSLDGMPESHNRMRASEHAFERMTTGVRRLRNAKVPFGFIFTLTLHNLHELAWITEFAVGEGAQLLQVHPLEQVGRARDGAAGHAPDNLELARAFLEVARLQERFKSAITLQYDVADVELLRAAPERGYAFGACSAGMAPPAGSGALGDLIAPVVLQADGRLVPLQHGFSRNHQIADIKRGCLREQIQGWKAGGYRAFLDLSNAVYEKIVNLPSEYPFVNWYGQMLQASFDSPICSSNPGKGSREHRHPAYEVCSTGK
jgi:hypothetical protein